MSEIIQVTTSTANREDAQQIARTLVERRLAACVQVSGPIESTYHWQGKAQTSEEWMCSIKTTRAAYDLLESFLSDLHPYDLPEIIVLPILGGSERYLKWVEAEVGANAK